MTQIKRRRAAAGAPTAHRGELAGEAPPTPCGREGSFEHGEGLEAGVAALVVHPGPKALI